MENEYLIAFGNALAEMRLLIEGTIVLYEEDLVLLHELAANRGLYSAASALDAIGTALYDMRTQIAALQAAYREEVACQAEIHLDE